MRTRVVLALVGVLLASCGAPADEVGGSGEPPETTAPETTAPETTTTVIVEPDYGPFLADDPFGVVAGLEWLEGNSAIPQAWFGPDAPIALLMEDSTAEVLHIAVNGGGCRPEVRIAVVKPPPALELGISVGGHIAPPGLQCGEVLIAHGFEVLLTEPVALDDVVLNPMLSEGGEDIVIIQPDTEGALPGEVVLTCPAGPAFPASALDWISPNLDTDPPGIPEAMASFLDGEEGRYWPQEGWRLLHRTDTSALVVHHDTGTGGLAFMTLEYEDGAWRWAGASQGGPCPLQIQMREGLGTVSWRVDPEAEPLSPETTSIPVLATELDCASGQPMGDRLVGPEVLMTDAEVLIVFGVEPLAGAQNCPSNPEQLVLVELPEPLGDRVVRDGMDTGLDLADFLE